MSSPEPIKATMVRTTLSGEVSLKEGEGSPINPRRNVPLASSGSLAGRSGSPDQTLPFGAMPKAGDAKCARANQRRSHG